MRPLKFKQIRKSIVSHKETSNDEISSNTYPLRRNLFGQSQLDSQMSFKSIKKSTMSPLKQMDTNAQVSTNKKNKFCFQDSAQRQNLSPLSNKKRMTQMQKSKGTYIYDSNRKTISYQKGVSKFGSQHKQNQSNSIYLNQENKQNCCIQDSILNFTQKERKLNTTRKNINDAARNDNSGFLYQTIKSTAPGSLTKKSSCNMLFKTALQTSNKKKTFRGNLNEDRSTARQSSIDKLKGKLFSMKKIISQKQNRPSNQLNVGQETKSFNIYTRKDRDQQKLPSNTSSKQIVLKQNGNTSFTNLVVDSVQNKLFKGTYLNLNFIKVENKISTFSNKISIGLNQSRTDSVNISMAQSSDYILDMSPQL